MKIGIDIRPLMDRYYGGVSEFTYQLLENLLAVDQENQYVLFYNSLRDVSGRVPAFKNPNAVFKCSRYPNKLFNYFLEKSLKYPKVDQKLKVDRFFMPHFNFIALRPKTELILTVHDLSFLRYREYFSLRKNLWHYLINARKLMKRADKIIAISANTKNDIIELAKVKEEKIKVIHSGIGPQFKGSDFKISEKQRIKEKYKLPARFLLSLNTIEPRKNVIGLIQAFNLYCHENKSDNIGLVLAGAMGWKYEKILKYRQNSPFKGRIHFIGYVDSEDKPVLYNLAEIFVYPSFYEGFGFPPLEAMAAGTPVIASAGSSLGEVCGSAAVLIDPNNPRQISQAISQILGDNALRDRLRRRGREQASKFSWEKAAREYYRVLFC